MSKSLTTVDKQQRVAEKTALLYNADNNVVSVLCDILVTITEGTKYEEDVLDAVGAAYPEYFQENAFEDEIAC